MQASTSVFEGIRILDIGHIVAGPFSASILADFGAEVIKIEKPVAGDPLRWIYPQKGLGLWYKVGARNKQSITLDLKSPEGRALFHKLVAQSDVVIENFRPGVMERLGNSWEVLSAINPRLILCRLSGYGQTGPFRNRRAYGRVAEAFSGFVNINGDPSGPPTHPNMALGDTTAGNWAAMGIMMALYWRDARGGTGQVIDLALYEALYRQFEPQIVLVDQLAKVQGRGDRTGYAPYQDCLPTRDGHYYSYSAITLKSALALLEAMGMAEDQRFNSWDRCIENRVAFKQAVSEWMLARTVDEVDAAFQAVDAPGAPVMSGADLIKHPHVLARDMVLTMQDKELGPVRMQGVVPKLSASPGKVNHTGQTLGESNERIYKELLGLGDAELASLREKAVI